MENPSSSNCRNLLGNPEAHYHLIGRTLSITEAACLHVGYPVFRNSLNSSLAAKYNPPLSEFIRLSLIEVPTQTLQLYARELLNLPHSPESIKNLSLPFYSLFQRYLLGSLALFVLGVFAAILFSKFSCSSFVQAFYMACVFFLAGIIQNHCSEKHRYISFHSLIRNEILRRLGLDHNKSTRIELLSADSEQLIIRGTK